MDLIPIYQISMPALWRPHHIEFEYTVYKPKIASIFGIWELQFIIGLLQ